MAAPAADLPAAAPAPEAAAADAAPEAVPASDAEAASTPMAAPASPPFADAAVAAAKRAQAKKGRCFQCRSRVPLVKQTTNRCRCDYVFCDAHRYPDKHSCEFDYKTSDRANLEKHNPKLNEKRKGGLSFTRID
ncbi:hypothetical protein H4R18_002305 [Coemansia javaensis]|uniref:AN1-type domain-containing protein n=1 Tax=Coemansia javaensis TaxID=2761396 RepID=A0A9W8LK31_9FUNG|nr:hypothetical protein H4R18_002305 [Coemansia javaensis]